MEEEHKMTFSKCLSQWIHLEVPSNFEGELSQRQADYADIKHCIECNGYKEHWSQVGTIAERMEFKYDTHFEKIFFYCGCGRKMHYSEYVFGSRSSEFDILRSPMLQMTLLQFLSYRLDQHCEFTFDPTDRLEVERSAANRWKKT